MKIEHRIVTLSANLAIIKKVYSDGRTVYSETMSKVTAAKAFASLVTL